MASRTLPNVGLKAFYNLGEDGWKDEQDLNLLKLSVLTQGGVISKVSATPGAPTNGDVHIFDETHATEPNKVAIRDNGAWIYVTPLEGWLLYNRGANRFEVFDGAVWAALATSGGSSVYVVPFGFTSAPTTDEVLLIHVFAETVDFADDWANSADTVGTNPTASFTLTLQKNGATIGTIVVSTGGAATFATTGGATNFVAGDVLTVLAPTTVDATVANCAFTLKGTRS